MKTNNVKSIIKNFICRKRSETYLKQKSKTNNVNKKNIIRFSETAPPNKNIFLNISDFNI